MDEIRPPKHLSREAKKIWRTINHERVMPDSYLVILRVSLEAYDRLQAARKILDEEGIYYKTETGYKREHPCLRIERDARSGFLAAWRQMNLNMELPGDV